MPRSLTSTKQPSSSGAGGQAAKRTVVTPALRRKWALAVLEGRQGEEQIAKGARVDLRTVRKHVSKGRDELALEQARGTLFQDALRRHFTQLCELAEALGRDLDKGTDLLQPLDSRSLRLLQALKAHLPMSPIWRAITRRAELVRNLELNRQDLKGRALRTATEAGLGEFGLPQLLVDEAQTQASSGRGIDRSGEWSRQGDVLTWGAYGIARVKDGLGGERAVVLELLGNTGGWPEVGQRRELLLDLASVNEILQEELEGVILRQILPGTCAYCPGGQVTVSRRASGKAAGRHRAKGTP